MLVVLDLSRNQLYGHIPTTVCSLKDITNFSLADNRLEGLITESFGELVSLKFLNLFGNNSSGEILASLKVRS
jgi:hypothetical protein